MEDKEEIILSRLEDLAAKSDKAGIYTFFGFFSARTGAGGPKYSGNQKSAPYALGRRALLREKIVLLWQR